MLGAVHTLSTISFTFTTAGRSSVGLLPSNLNELEIPEYEISTPNFSSLPVWHGNTQVATADGPILFNHLNVGDRIWSFSLLTMSPTLRPITHIYQEALNTENPHSLILFGSMRFPTFCPLFCNPKNCMCNRNLRRSYGDLILFSTILFFLLL